jgi:hypothetical protein
MSPDKVISVPLLAEWLKRLTANVEVATVLGSIPGDG